MSSRECFFPCVACALSVGSCMLSRLLTFDDFEGHTPEAMVRALAKVFVDGYDPAEMDSNDELLFGRPNVTERFSAQFDGVVLLTDNFVRPEIERFYRLMKQVYGLEVFRFSYADAESDVRALLNDAATRIYVVDGHTPLVRTAFDAIACQYCPRRVSNVITLCRTIGGRK
eukprot:m.1180316 g.1180316  ORF g.1180316 m.1180316 type:complete len:171 (+) comp24532_c0_seq24:1823-2335(+)